MNKRAQQVIEFLRAEQRESEKAIHPLMQPALRAQHSIHAAMCRDAADRIQLKYSEAKKNA